MYSIYYQLKYLTFLYFIWTKEALHDVLWAYRVTYTFSSDQHGPAWYLAGQAYNRDVCPDTEAQSEVSKWKNKAIQIEGMKKKLSSFFILRVQK